MDKRWVSIVVGAAVILGVGWPRAWADSDGDLSLISKKVIEPMARLEIGRHLDAVFVRRDSRELGPLRDNEAKAVYWYTVQLPDGSMMRLPESYEVTRTGESVSKERYSNMTTYDIRREGGRGGAISVGVTPSNEVVVLTPGMGISPAGN